MVCHQRQWYGSHSLFLYKDGQERNMLTWCLLLLFPVCNSMVPPEYEGQHFCPPGFDCLQHKYTPPGFSGAFGQLFQCCNSKSGAVAPVTSWGPALDLAQKESLFKNQYTDVTHKSCSREPPCAPILEHGLYVQHAGANPLPSAHARAACMRAGS